MCKVVALLFPLLPQSAYGVKYGDSLFQHVLIGNKCFFAFIKLLFADSSLVAFTLHLIWKTLLSPYFFFFSIKLMYSSRHGKLWDHRSGSTSNSNSLHGAAGPSRVNLSGERACDCVSGCQGCSSDYLVHCLSVWRPAFPSMLKSKESSSTFHCVLFCFSDLKQKPSPLPLRQVGQQQCQVSLLWIGIYQLMWPH